MRLINSRALAVALITCGQVMLAGCTQHAEAQGW